MTTAVSPRPVVNTAKLPTAAYDNKIYTKFSPKTIEKKAVNKEEFQKEFGLLPEKRTLLLGFALPLTEKNGADILAEILPGLAALEIQVVFLGIGTEKYQRILTEFSEDNKLNTVILENTEENLRKFYAAVDSVLLFSKDTSAENCLEDALSYGVIPIAPVNAFENLADYNPNQEKGNAFLYASQNSWKVFAAIVRAMENYKFPYDWKNIAKEAMNSL